MIKRLGAALVAALLLFGCEDSVLDPTTEATGKVVDHVTNEPLEDVTVVLYENDDVLLGGAREIARQRTDANGNFAFQFEWKESPYKLRFHKPGYTFNHVEYNERFKNLPPIVTEYRVLESLKKKQDFLIDMEPVGSIALNLTDSEPQRDTNRITFTFMKMNKVYAVYGPLTYSRGTILDAPVSTYATAKRRVKYTYTIEKDGVSQTTTDSVYIEHSSTPVALNIVY